MADVEDRDRTLVERAQKGDDRAMEALYREHKQSVFGYAKRALGREDAAEDVTQETFVKAFRAVSKFRGQSTFRTWLFSIAINTTRTKLRKLPREDAEPLNETMVSEDQPSSTIWLKRQLTDALTQLPEGYREVVIMHDVLDMRHEEIAAARKCTVGTSKSQLHKARAKLRTMLRPILGGAHD